MAKRALLGRLQDAEPDRFSRAHLRTFQRAYIVAEGAAVARHHGKPAGLCCVRNHAAPLRWNAEHSAHRG